MKLKYLYLKFFNKKYFNFIQEHLKNNIDLFIHIPKNGGLGINLSLYNNDGLGHLPLSLIEQFPNFQLFKSRKIYAIIRCPVDRSLSTINFVKAGGINNEFRDCVSMSPYQILTNKKIQHNKPQTYFIDSKKNHEIYTIDFEDLKSIILNNNNGNILKLNNRDNSKKINATLRKIEYSDLSQSVKSLIQKKYYKDFKLYDSVSK